MADNVVHPLMVRDFSKVILTLDNVLVPAEKLSETPSMQDGLDSETETDLRILGCELIQTSGILLKLPQVAMATGQVLFQRFYYSKSFVKHNMEVVAMACINLASKIEESPRRIRDVINVFHHIKQLMEALVSGMWNYLVYTRAFSCITRHPPSHSKSWTIQPLILDQNYINIKNQVIKAERRILKELGFCVHVKHPHKIIVMYLQVLDSASNRRLVQCAWNYMNDSFRTNVFMKYQPETIACACIYLAARQLEVPLPESPPWYYLFEVEESDIREICITLLKLYSRPKPNCDELEKIVEKAKKIQVEAKLKAKGLAEYGTPNSTSRQNSPKNISPSPYVLPGTRKVKIEEDHSDGSHGSHNHVSRKRGHSGSDLSHSGRSRSHSHSRSTSSRSISRSPLPHKKYRSPSRKIKKERRSPIRFPYKEKHSHKRKRRSRSRSRSRSRDDRYLSKSSLKKYYKEKDRGYSPERHRSRKHRNGHRSSSRDRYDKYRR